MIASTGGAGSINALFFLSATLMVGYGAVFSLLAEIRDAFGFTAAGIGLIGGSAFAAGFVAQLGLSRYADSGHGAKMLQIGLALSAIGTLWMIFADTLPHWLAARALLGFGAGCVRPAVRRLVLTDDPARAGQAIGRLSAYETAGFLLGPVLASILNAWAGLSSIFVALTAILILLTPVVLHADIPGATNPSTGPVIRRLIASPAMQSCIAIGVAFWITVGVFEAIWAVFLSDLGASQIFIGLTMSLFGIPMIFISPRAGSLAQHKGPLKVAMVSVSGAIVCMVLYGLFDSLWVLCVPLGIHAIVDAFTMPASQLAVAQASGEGSLAAGQGLFGATGMAVAAVTAVGGGALYQTLGASGLWWISAFAMVICMAFAWWRGAALRRPMQAHV
ncbi:MAG: MFS transporter [Gammaproteobacteria bacterium]|nr:MFS transporter [Gammaproteobacteria bacterium]